MSRVIPAILLIVALGVSLAAYFPVLEVFFSRRIARTRRVVEELPARSFWIGLVNFVFLAIIVLALFGIANAIGGRLQGVLALVVVIILAPVAVGLSLGLAAVIQAAGARLMPEKGRLGQSIWATEALLAACALPFVGWFILSPYVVWLGLGAFVLGLFSKAEVEEAEVGE